MIRSRVADIIGAAVSLVAIAVGAAGASPDRLNPAAGTDRSGGHAWLAVPATKLSPEEISPFQLYHVPPRGGAMFSEDGTLRTAQSGRLLSRPDRLAATGDTVWIVMEPSGDTGKPVQRTVLSLSAVRHEMAELWRDEPEGYPDARPSLSGPGLLHGLAAGPWGLAAVLDARTQNSSGGLTLKVLAGTAWSTVEMPDVSAQASVSLASGKLGPTLIALTPGVSVDVWRCEPAQENGKPNWVSRPVWRHEVLPLARGTSGLSDASWAVWRDAGTSLYAAWEKPGSKDVVIAEFLRSGPVEFSSVSGEGRPAVAFTDSRAQVFWFQVGDRGQAGKLAVAEVSLLTGRALYRGPARAGLPITDSDVRLLLLTLTILAASVVVFVIRGESARVEVTLPEGFALAETSSRVLATLLDLLLVAFITSRITGVPLGQLFVVKVAAGTELMQFALMSAVVGALQGFVLEGLFGRTLGKMLTGLVVGRVVSGGVEGVPLWSALVRNLVKWLLPPVGMLGLMEHNARHRGDVWGQTVVVTSIPSPDNFDDED